MVIQPLANEVTRHPKPRASLGFLISLAVIGGVVAGWAITLTSATLNAEVLKAVVSLVLLNMLILFVLRGRHLLALNLAYCLAFAVVSAFILEALSSIR